MYNPNPSQNLQAVACYSSSSFYYLRYLQSHRSLTLNETLAIDKASRKIKTLKSFDKVGLTEQRYSAFLGVASIQSHRFLVFCDQCKRACSLPGMEVYEVSSLAFLSYLSEEEFRESEERRRIYEKIRDYYAILKQGFYFSHQYRLTLPYGKQEASEITATFVWNQQFLAQLDLQGAPQYWKSPLIQGFVSSFEVFYQGAKIKYCLITRRSSIKGGTRYFDRGVNDQGYVANYCQTEQIVKIDEFCFSDLQIRGSLPVFFQQIGLYTKTKVNRGFELTHQSFEKHMERLFEDFKRVLMVNLLTTGKRGERLLTETVEEHIKAFDSAHLKYLYYDFHLKVKGGHYQAVDEIIGELRRMKENLSYYSYNGQLNKVLSQQAGVVRTNCLDCLDRTNFFQAKLAIITLQHIFRKLQIAQLDLLAEMRTNRDNAFIKKFRNIWADNGDAISYHYTGTGSTHTDITRDGRRGLLGNIKHKYKTVTRFYNQNFWDFYKMRVVNDLLGYPTTIQKPETTRLLQQSQQEFIHFEQSEVFVLTWKAPKAVPRRLPALPSEPQLLVISIQDLTESDKWLGAIGEAVDREKYMKVEAQYKNNNLLVVYARHQLRERISGIEQGSLKFRSYYNAFMSNKSANFIRFNLFDSKLVFVGCQLQKGREFTESRIRNLKQIHEFAFQIEEVGLQKSQTILFDDAIFLIGNMNTAISPSFKQQIGRLNLKQPSSAQAPLLKKLLKTDEFSRIRLNLMECRQYEQGPITFLPTYRYINGHLDPDVSGWPDRIWFSSDSRIKCTKYDTFEELKQEHVAVIGHFQLEVKRVNEEMQERVESNLLSKKQSEGEDDDDDDQTDEKIPL